MNLIFNQLIIIDTKLKEAKKIIFSAKMNLITSDENSKGKSIILKSLYHTLGANCLFDANFKKDDMIFDLLFTYNNIKYEIIRLKNDYIILKGGRLLDSIKYGNIIKLSQFFKNELNMFVYLKDRFEDILLAPPAYLFVPYYLDQDISWKNEQEPFEKLGQFEKISRNQLYYYHLGIFSNEYFELDSSLKQNCDILNKIKAELKNKDYIFSELKKELGTDIAVNIQELDIDLRNLKYSLSETTDKIEKTKSKIYEKENEIILLQSLVENINSTLTQVNKQINTSSKHVKCPSCKYEFDVNLKEEIENLYDSEFLVNRKEKCEIDIESLKVDVAELKKELEKYLNEVKEAKDKIFKKEVNYKDYLNREVIQGLLTSKAEEIAKLEESYQLQKNKCIELQLKLDNLNQRRVKVGPIFKQFYKSNLISLGVHSFSENSIKAFYKLAISGSLFVRSTLAFFYAFLDTKAKFNSNKFICPLVIDSPRDGEQDDVNSKLIMEYIFSRNVGDYQLIVASVDAEKYIKDEMLLSDDITITKISGEKNHLLNNNEYNENLAIIDRDLSYFGLKIK